ncbi:hypothetical protein [Pseudomonas multiresinivorans]|uniref:Uncharacterized protein n=1 Tax=Pseudomonas multiresinivorans TaxID=95301 RepID=A0A7Z3BLY3_9PSED|nr:hypothetical protein [Pseudomonas multiresinivorans]QJP09351.1 hypothetical protein G4G71_16205 [Pseudomonas multiresinivorans]
MAGSPYWSDQSFQKHANRSANISIETLRVLFDITIKENHLNGKSLIQLSGRILGFLSSYQYLKMKIPTDSDWYPLQFKHRDWYSTAGHNVMIAHKTGTALQPEMTRSQFWMEIQLQRDVLQALSVSIEGGRFLEAKSLLNYLDQYIQVLVISGFLERAFDFAEEISETVSEAVKSQSPASSQLVDLERLSIIEGIATIPISIALALANHSESVNVTAFSESLKRINWGSKGSLYGVGLPSYLVSQGEWLFDRIAVEKLSEGRVISPT